MIRDALRPLEGTTRNAKPDPNRVVLVGTSPERAVAANLRRPRQAEGAAGARSWSFA
jgi:hypothetical protein